MVTVEPEQNSWRDLWLSYISDGLLQDSELERGLKFAQRFDDLEVDLLPTIATMRARSGPRMIYDVRLTIPRPNLSQWEKLESFVSSRPDVVELLRQGELSARVGHVILPQELGLLPPSSDIEVTCSCPNAAPCKHIGALCCVLATVFDENPFELLRLLGRDKATFCQPFDFVEATNVYDSQSAADAWNEIVPPLPPPLEAPQSMGGLLSWPTDPPENELFTSQGLRRLGSEAIDRADAMMNDAADSSMALSFDADLARLAANADDLEPLVSRSGVSLMLLQQHGQIWDSVGADGIEALTKPAEVRGDDAVQYRRTNSGRWFRFFSDGGVWQLTGGPVPIDDVPQH